ncbi:MAG: hypothetical protein J6U51_06895 [Bacteroidales bacterium]|nr:hypothetical protein [Bacteroidales bacterium]
MKASELNDMIRQYHWGKEILEEYEKMYARLTKERKEYITIDSVRFTNRGGTETINLRLNPHRSIDPQPFLDAFVEQINSIKKDLATLRSEIEKVVELDC